MPENTPSNVRTLHPNLPYGNPPTSGHAGSETSEARAVRQDSDGTTASRQAQVIEFLNQRGAQGATWREVATRFSLHHGAASGVLSVLHKDDRVKRLASVRNGCKVYVHPAWAGHRMTEAHGRTGTRTLMDQLAQLVHDFDSVTQCDHLPGLNAPECLNCRAGEALRHYNSISGTSL